MLDDVVKRFRVEHIGVLEKLLAYLLATAGNVTTHAALARKSAALGVPLKNATVIDYVSYLRKSLALMEVGKFSWKQSRHFTTTRKYYAVDPGLATIVRPVEENLSYRLENVVFLELVRRGYEVFFGSGDAGREIDFLARSPAGWLQCQVTDTLTPENRKRELGAFVLAAPYLEGERLLLSRDEVEEDLVTNGVAVRRRNLIRWLLER